MKEWLPNRPISPRRASEPRKAVSKSSDDLSASERIEKSMVYLSDWRGERLAKVRRLIHEVYPEVVEDWKWSESYDVLASHSSISAKVVRRSILRPGSNDSSRHLRSTSAWMMHFIDDSPE